MPIGHGAEVVHERPLGDAELGPQKLVGTGDLDAPVCHHDSCCPLADDLLRPLVVAKTDVARMSQLAVGGPLAEADLCDQLGSHPMHALLRPGPSCRRRLGPVRSRGARTAREHRELALAEAGAHLAAEPQLALFVVADQQRSEPGARPTGIGPPQHDELLLAHALELQPVVRAPVRVRSRGLLGDEALPTLLASGAERDLSLLVQVLGETDRVLEDDRAVQHRLPREQRQRGEVVPVEPDQVEQVEDHRYGRDLYGTRSRVLHPLLQARERGDISAESHDLTVRDQGSGVVPQNALDQIGIVRREVLLVPRDQPDGRAPPPQQRALTVELGLEHPRRVGERVFGQRGQHRRREGRHGATFEQSPIACIEFLEDGIHMVEGRRRSHRTSQSEPDPSSTAFRLVKAVFQLDLHSPVPTLSAVNPGTCPRGVRTYVRVRRGHDPARRRRLLLCVGRAAG